MSELKVDRIVAPNPSLMTLDGTCTYVVTLGEGVVVIDPGPLNRSHITAVEDAIGDRRAAIVCTHSHSDHNGAAVELCRRVRGEIWSYELQTQRVSARVGDQVRLFSPSPPGDAFPGPAGLELIWTPGHAPDHLCVVARTPDRRVAVVWVGDLLLGEGETSVIAAPEGNIAAYFRSLDRLAALQAERLLPGHGPPIDDPASVIQKFRTHREQRIAQIAQVLMGQPGVDVQGVVHAVYGDSLPPELRPAAEGSIVAVLEYFEELSGDEDPA